MSDLMCGCHDHLCYCDKEEIRDMFKGMDAIIENLLSRVYDLEKEMKELEESIEQTDHWLDTVNEQVQTLSKG